MAGTTKIGGTNYVISGGKARIGGTIYDIAGGKTRINSAIYDISFGPDPLQIYSEGDTSLKNGATLSVYSDGEINFNSNGINMRSKYGWAIVSFTWAIPMELLSGYRKAFITLVYVDAGTPDDARVGWGNGRYGFNLTYYSPASYANRGTTKYQELSFIGATTEQTFILDISEVAGVEEIQFGVRFKGSGVDGGRDNTYALIKDIHLE